jgi:hypothetical protein
MLLAEGVPRWLKSRARKSAFTTLRAGSIRNTFQTDPLPLLLCPRFAGASFSRATLRSGLFTAGRELATNLDRTR